MQAAVVFVGVATAITKEAGEGIVGTGVQFLPQDIQGFAKIGVAGHDDERIARNG
jgi:hypothetical protein